MITFLLFCFGIAAGTLFGMSLSKVRLGMMPWKLMKWHPDSLGYRIVPGPSPRVRRGDKVYLAIPLDTSRIKPGEEIIVSSPD